MNVSISKLELDLKNPRFESQPNQRAALEKLVDSLGEKLIKIAKDIAEKGVNPADLLMIIDSGNAGRYTVLEGNRRLAALKLLRNKTLLNSLGIPTSIKKRIGEIAASAKKLPASIECAHFNSREAARHWIELKHTGERGGVGTVDWDALAVSRFHGTEAALHILDFVRQYEKDDTELLELLETFPITNLTRLTDDPDVRRALGVEKAGSKLVSIVPFDELRKSMRKVVSDIARKEIRVGDIKRKDDRLEYLDRIRDEFLPKTEIEEKWSLDSRTEPPTAPASATPETTERPPRKRATKQSTLRRRLIPSTCVLKIGEPRINAIYDELKNRLSIDETPNAVAVSFRVFLELSLDSYAGTHGIPKYDKDKQSLVQKVSTVGDYMEQSSILSKHEMKPLRVACSNPHDKSSPSTFNAYIHNMHMNPIGSDLIKVWDSLSKFFEKVWPA